MSHSRPTFRSYDSVAPQTTPRRSPYSSGPTTPMAIPHARGSPPPPPLPPPRHVTGLGPGNDPGWHWGNSPGSETYNNQPYASVKPGSSLLGGGSGNLPTREKTESLGDRSDHAPSRRQSTFSNSPKAIDTNMTNDADEDRLSMRRPSMADFETDRKLTGQQQMQSSKSYDQQLLSKIGANPNATSRSNGAATNGTSVAQHNGQLKPLSMASPPYPSMNSPSRWTSGPLSPNHHLRSPSYEPNSLENKHTRLGSIQAVAEQAHRVFQNNVEQNSYHAEADFPMDEGNMKDLNLHDHSPGSPDDRNTNVRTGSKRRAQSPDAFRDDRPIGENSVYHRRSQQFREQKNSPMHSFHHGQPGGSLSTISTMSQRGSYTPSLGISVASSATSYSGERLTPPSALSPGIAAMNGVNPSPIDPELGPTSPPYGVNGPHTAAARGGPLARAAPSHQTHQRTSSSHITTGDLKHPHPPSQQQQHHHRGNMASEPQPPPQPRPLVAKLGGNYVCECCPKKPKKFDNESDLRAHESEKQYTCAYCPNRFKNKNEAERHQNSLHLRKHSWSCAALAGVGAAYHESTSRPGEMDVCGYCGLEFPNPPNLEARTDHLNHQHKYGECNQAKKFFRADHFRQHLKHSHAGTSGKWTNMLELACMKEEPQPKERHAPTAPMTSGAPAGPVSAYHQPPGVINEARDES